MYKEITNSSLLNTPSMWRIHKLSLLLFLTALIINGKAQEIEEKAVVASAGSKSITVRDFEERYEFTPHIGTDLRSNPKKNQLDFLYSLIAEKLWATDAEKRGLDTLEAMQTVTASMMRLFTLDELYKKVIREKVTISEKEMKTAIDRQTSKLYINYLISSDSAEIHDLFNLIKNGVPFDTILAESPEREEQKTPLEIVYGQMELSIENELYSLKKGEITKPIYTPDGWYIFRLTNRSDELMVLFDKDSEAWKQAEKTLRARKEKEEYERFFAVFFNKKSITADAVLLRSLTVHLKNFYEEKIAREKLQPTERIMLDAGDVSKLLAEIAEDTLQSVFLKINNKEFSLRTFILLIAFDGIALEKYDIESVYRYINMRARKFVERELLFNYACEMNIDKSEEVLRQFTMWKENYLYQFLRSQFNDSVSVSDEEVRLYYDKRFKETKFPRQLNIIEILTDSLELVDIILKEYSSGADFRALAKKYNKRKSTLATDGEYGYFPEFLHGDIGRTAVSMEVGEVFGPLKLPEGYSIIKLIGKKDEYIVPPSKSFEQAKEDLRREIKGKRIKAKIDNHTIKLARSYGVNINAEVFSKLHTTQISSFGIRYTGFGGQITAAPLLAPDNDWVKYFLDPSIPLP